MAKEKAQSPDGEKIKVNRREFLNLAWLASMGVLTANVAGLTYFFAMPRFEAGEFGGVFTVGKVSELPKPTDPPANYPKVKLWLSNTDQGVMGIYKVCTHLGCLYGWSDQENHFNCPCHGSQFSKDGTYEAGPAPRSLDRFVIRVIDPVTNQILRESSDGQPLSLDGISGEAIIEVDTGVRIKGASKA